ncbi:LacI family DNA-binding transcriptional regulator [Streptococcus merionis]|uniref:Repressor protein n=1 Tax=Streptococcus merionis TaxID=400065 RepID=A0A239SY98_9STRE|nr:LacI family DNA-binding transcriptional regulator [Streptococcus merionis]SNU90505.1 repressor protein [Streptococcus merionis]
MKRVRLKDIAHLANVSETAVSLVLNHRPSRISDEKKNEIFEIAKQLNYQPNQVARSLVSQKSNMIGLVVPDITNPFFATLSKNIEKSLQQMGYLLIIANSDNSSRKESELVRSLVNHQVEGLLICPSNEDISSISDTLQLLKQLSVPFLIIDRIFEGDDSMSQISFDNEQGGFLATRYLIDQGCKSIACITGNLNSYNARKRLDGYKSALKEAGLPYEENWIQEGDYSFSSGKILGARLLEYDIDGVFACNDLMAYGFLNSCRSKDIHLKIPVVGYDNLEISNMFDIHIPSIAQDTDLLSKKCCEKIVQAINQSAHPHIELIPPRIIKF